MNPTIKIRVMFIDDEPNTLRGLERAFRSHRDRWDMTFVTSGEAALKVMEESPVDVVICDMRMPGMNGAQLLNQLKEKYPRTVRLILSGYADRDLILQCVGSAHQYLCKPCNPLDLCSAISRASDFNASMKSERIKAIVAETDCLPSIPSLLSEIIEHLQKDDSSVDEVGEIIGKDIAMSAKILKLVNSAFFGLRRQISTPGEAVTFLGLETIKALVLTASAFATYEKQDTGPILLESVWNHSLEVAGTARKIAAAVGADRTIVEESFVAGMLHDIGKLSLGVSLPKQYLEVFGAAERLGLSLHAAEEAAFGAHHGDLGGYLLSLWGLPTRIVNAITLHHEPQREGSNEFTPLAAVHIANGLSHERRAQDEECLNLRFIEDLRLSHRLPEWRLLGN